MDEKLIQKAIEIAKEDKHNFGCDKLRRELRIGLGPANRILEELEKRNIITISLQPQYNIEVLI